MYRLKSICNYLLFFCKYY